MGDGWVRRELSWLGSCVHVCVYHTPLFPVQNCRATFVHEEQMEMDGQPYCSEDELPTSGQRPLKDLTRRFNENMSVNIGLLISSTPTSQIRWDVMPSHISNCPI